MLQNFKRTPLHALVRFIESRNVEKFQHLNNDCHINVSWWVCLKFAYVTEGYTMKLKFVV